MRFWCALVALLSLTALTACTEGSWKRAAPTTEIITPSTVAPSAWPTFEKEPFDGPVRPGESGIVKLRVGDKDREFLLHVPAGYSGNQEWPLILAFPGYTESASFLQRNTGLDHASALVVYAQGYEDAWAPAPYAKTSLEEDLAYSEEVVASVEKHYAVDTKNIALTGFSNGGGFAAALACRIPEKISGVAVVSGAYYENVHRDCVDTPVPHLEIRGTADPVIGYYGGTRHKTAYESAEDVLHNAALRNKCEDKTTVSRESQGTVNYRWNGCERKLEHVRIGGGGHVWPGGYRDTTTQLPEGYGTYRILRFFDIAWT